MAEALWKEFVISILALLFTGWAGWLDWRTRRIPNWLTVPGLLLGLALNSALFGWAGTKSSLEGAGLGLGLLLPFVLARGLGAGDWKLMGALGALLGPEKFIAVLLGTVFIAGIMAVVEMVRRRRVKETLANTLVLIHAFATFGLRPKRENITLDNPGLMAQPFGVAAALAMVIFFFAQSALRAI
ncbi:MAG TPA: A24 family peptidase [Terriglobia bacterium]|jgi:prepilin peptidase CpaA|nr:A24 family peptidase [Terriglobia bacterium]